MSEHMFGVGNGKVSGAARERIAAAIRPLGVTFTNPTLPEGPRYWFAGPNHGEPFNREMERRTWERLRYSRCLDGEGNLLLE